jgi:DNA-binding response OmpR family regulator
MPSARILVVDDEPAVLETLAWGLRRAGFDVVAHARFADARRQIDTDPPDALVTDVRLGAFNGLQLALHMRQAKPNAPIIVLSGFDDSMLRKEAEALGGVYLTKPLTGDTLARYLTGAVGTANAVE